MRTIIIDDEPWMLRHFSDECAGLDNVELVGSFRNPLKALEYARSNPVDLAFVDMEMPQLNGAETAKELRQRLPGVVIVIVSAYDESYVREKRECDAYGYLRKPYKREDLRGVIDKMVTK